MRASIILVSLLTTLTSACLYPRAASDKPTYTYDGESGPIGWHLLPNNTLCGEGRHQSPINVSPNTSGVTQTKNPLTLKYPKYSNEIEVENNGYTIVFTPKDVGEYTAVLEGTDYQLLQFHFHTPSEHMFADESYPLEVHFVHKSKKEGKLAVVGIFFEMGFDYYGDRFLSGTTQALKDVKNAGDKKTIRDVNLQSVMSIAAESKTYSYAGSLTTPPCSEGVTWYVIEQSLSMSVAQFQAWKGVMKFNSRNTQNAPGRQNLIQIAAGKTMSEGENTKQN